MANTIIKGVPDDVKKTIGEYGMNLLSKIHQAIPGTMWIYLTMGAVPGIVIDAVKETSFDDYLNILKSIDPVAYSDEVWGLAFISGDGIGDLTNKTLYEWED